MGAFDGLRGTQISQGYWGEHTGTIDWCETNYTHTPLIAEFYNTITNLPIIFGGVYGALMTVSGGVHKRYALLYLALSLIGIGSFGFHASLRWEWQLMDELPMIYGITYAAYLMLDTLPSFEPRYGIWGPVGVIVFCVGITLSYIWMPNPIYHQVAFAALLLFVVIRNFILQKRLPANHDIRRKISKELRIGVAVFFIGFVIWNIDNVFCDQLRAMRGEAGFFGFLLQGHGYWHVLTFYGAYSIATAGAALQLSIKVSPDAYTFDDTAWLPTVRATLPAHSDVKQSKVQGSGNTTPPVAEKPVKESVKISENTKVN